MTCYTGSNSYIATRLYKKGHFAFNTARLTWSFNRDRYYQIE